MNPSVVPEITPEHAALYDALYVYAWFTGFAIAGAVYFIGMKTCGRRARMEA